MKYLFFLLFLTFYTWADDQKNPSKQINIDEEIINDLEFFQSIELINESDNTISTNSLSHDDNLFTTIIKDNTHEN